MSREYDDDELEEFVRQLRNKLGFGPNEPLTAHDLLAREQSRTNRLKIITMDDDTFGSARGRTIGHDNEIRFPKSIFIALCNGCADANFIGAEEVMHYSLGHQNVRDNTAANRIDHRARLDPVADREEWEAKYAARAVLAPIEMVNTDASPEEIARQFNLPINEATQRLKDVTEVRRRAAGEARVFSDKVISISAAAHKMGRPFRNIPIARNTQTMKEQNADLFGIAGKTQKVTPYEGAKCSNCLQLSLLEGSDCELFCSECDWRSGPK